MRAHPLDGEFQGSRSDREDGVEAEAAILLDDIVDELLAPRILGEAIEIQKLVVERDARGVERVGSNDRLQRVGECHSSRRIGIVAVEHQHTLRRRGLSPDDGSRRKQQRREPRCATDRTRFHGESESRRCAECRSRTR